MLAKEWGRSVRQHRQAKFPTQEALAREMGRDQSWVSRYERGDATWTPEVMLTFSVALGVPPAQLFPWSFVGESKATQPGALQAAVLDAVRAANGPANGRDVIDEVSSRLGVSRNSVSAVLHRLRTNGTLREVGRHHDGSRCGRAAVLMIIAEKAAA